MKSKTHLHIRMLCEGALMVAMAQILSYVKLSEAPSYGEPISYHEPYGKGSLEYTAVAKELMMRI